ncbi:efflux RND transporter periplasmic adaptor subunit [uncultured Alsobacter sp.]|uniref:efflux RND transporter periplasmic adaptor subunit n=1 Tax=uncultured Alsobacter sp. TaxID=1748258 RepID=UPI0025CC0D6C|nr:efflux RND transporter periplasmic adaptor subunit [uncultured Alsobacter sp.]
MPLTLATGARAGVVALLSVLVAACQPATPAAPPAAQLRPVYVATVRGERPDEARNFVAVIRPRIEIDQGFRVPGKVARRLVDVGQTVAAGQPLALLDDTDLTLQREQAEADLRSVGASLAQAEAEEQRILSLRRQGWSTDSTYERQKAAADDLRARLDRAERAVALARNASAYATLKADAEGVVTATLVEPGQVVSAGQTAIRIARSGEREAVVAVPESFVASIGDAESSLALWSAPDRRYRAMLRELSPVADAATRTYTARFSLPEADDAVKLGMTATLASAPPRSTAALRLPLSALFNQGNGPSVWTVDQQGLVTLRPVEVTRYEAREVVVKSGVAEGEQVVALGVHKLEPGQKVRVVSQLGL